MTEYSCITTGTDTRTVIGTVDQRKTRTAAQRRAGVDGSLTNDPGECRWTDAQEGVWLRHADTLIQTWIRYTPIDTGFTTKTRIADWTRALVTKSTNQIGTVGIVQTRIGETRLSSVCTVDTAEAWLTDALIAIECIQTEATILTRRLSTKRVSQLAEGSTKRRWTRAVQ